MNGPTRRRALAGLCSLGALGCAAGGGAPVAWAGPADREAGASDVSVGAGATRATGAAAARVLIVGAGWAGLAAAHALTSAVRRGEAPALDLTLVDRGAEFRSLPLSGAWLVGREPERLPRVDLAALGRARGWRHCQAEVIELDRVRRELRTTAGVLRYDALLLATGALADHAAWTDGDPALAAALRERCPAGFQAAELGRLQQALHDFEGGDLVLTVPPAPYRCPPAPYERAVLLAWWLRQRGLAGRSRITVLDAGGGMLRYNRLFAERHAGLIDHRPHTVVRRVDPHARRLDTSAGLLQGDLALVLPPMGAGALHAQAGLLARDAQGRPGRWAAVDAATLRSPLDEHIWLAGDALDSVSPLFGAYPKTAQIAADLGAAAARSLLATLAGQAVPDPASLLPSSQCHVWLNAEPDEQLRLDTRYRLRGDGLIVQAQQQVENPQPRGEDLAWARGLLRERLGLAA